MSSRFHTPMLLLMLGSSLYAQTGGINNTLGTGGSFTIKDGSTTLLSLSQSTGDLNLNKNLTLPVTTGSTLGVIFKGADRFMHDYQVPGTNGGNTFVGVNAGNFTMSGILSYQASYNTSVGYFSLTSLTTGYFNSAFGYASLFWNSAGTSNSAFGYYAGVNLTTGSNNTLIGYDAQASSATVSTEITLGNSSVATLRCQVTTITALSDARDKKNIKDLPVGLDFLMKVHPRRFNWDRRQWYDNNISDGSKMQKAPTAGFIAQELDSVQTAEHAEWLNLVLKSNPDRLEATPGNLLPIMVKAIQDVKREKDKEIAELKFENKELKVKLAQFERVQEILAGEMKRLKSEEGRSLGQLRSGN